MHIEHVGRQVAVHFETVGRRHPLIEPQRGDPKNLGERGFLFGRGVVAQPPLELAQDRFLAVAAHADNEGHAEFFTVGVVEAMESGELRFAQPVEPGAGLLGGGIHGELALARGFAGKIGMAVDQRALSRLAGVAHRVGHRLVKCRETRERPRRISLVRHPRRQFHHFAERGGKGVAVGGVEGVE